MELWHERPAGETARLASEVTVADGRLEQARGRMFTRSFPDGSALVFDFERVDRRSLHMFAVPYSIDAIWTIEGEVTKVKRLAPMIGIGWGRADMIVELPAGTADGVEVGDTIRLSSPD